MLRFNSISPRLFLAAFFLAILAININAQGSSFTFQGKLNDTNAAANGTYEMQFRLLDNQGNQVGATNTFNNVSVTGGIFTVRLTFGIPALDGSPRFLEIGVRPAGSTDPFTILNPPQSILSAPYAVRSLLAGTADLATLATNSNQLGGIAANQYVLTGDVRLSDARNPLAGSGNYIQNTTAQQSTSNFNISGTGRANIFNAVTQFNLNNNRILSSGGTNNLFAGVNSATNNTGSGNAFFGASAGQNNTTGINNAFFGFNAGSANNGGGANAFFGVNAGTANIGSSNNTFLGANAGNTNLTGNGNTYIGANSDGGFLITNSVAIGQKAFVGQSNALVLGSINGINGATANTDVGIGTSTPLARFHVVGDSILNGWVGIGTTTPQARLNLVDNNPLPIILESSWTGGTGIQFINTGGGGTKRWTINADFVMSFRNQAASGDILRLTNTGGNGNGTAFVFGDLNVDSTVSVGTMVNGLSTSVCWNSVNKFLGTCSSSIRYKKDLQPFTGGLSLLKQFNPVTFRWKSDDTADLGFVAEDVAAVEPLLTTTNKDGQIEGVKYDRISAVLVNAVKEQQAQIERQQKQIDKLKAIVCALKPEAEVCAKPD